MESYQEDITRIDKMDNNSLGAFDAEYCRYEAH